MQSEPRKKYLCWGDEPRIRGIEVFEIWDTPRKENSYPLDTVYCPECGPELIDGLLFHNYETIHVETVDFEDKHAYCTLCKRAYFAHEIIHLGGGNE